MEVYLAGPIKGLEYSIATDWRNDVTNRLAEHGIVCASPMRGKSYLAHEQELGDKYDAHILSTAKAIVTRDRWDTTTCDLVLMNVIGAERVSIGTMIEAGWADASRVPIVLAMEDGNVHDHGMLTEIAGFRTLSLVEAVETIIAINRKGNLS